MSWIIKLGPCEVKDCYFEKIIDFNDGGPNPARATCIRDDAKRFETKADAKAVQDQYGLGGSIIPA